MFNKNKKRIKVLEQKVEALSTMMKVRWEITNRHEGSPPHVFYSQYEANHNDIIKKLLEFLGLEVYEERERPALLEIRKKVKK